MSETLGTYRVSIHKVSKDFYTYTLDVWATEDASDNPPTKTVSGSAFGIGQAMATANDMAFNILQDNDRVK